MTDPQWCSSSRGPAVRVQARRSAVGLLHACHLGPTVVVTTVSSLLAWAISRDVATTALVGGAVGSGQLSVGWSNDANDAAIDRRAGRDDKPIVSGEVTRPAVWAAALIALVLAVLLSFVAGGMVGGAAHVVAVSSAWVYNLRLARTAWSFLPYMISFGLLLVFIVGAATRTDWPTAWSVVAFVLVAAGAHLANGLKDVDSDRAVGLGGTVQRLGERAARRWAGGAFGVATLAIAVGAWGAAPPVAVGLPVLAFVTLVVPLWAAPATWRFRIVLIAALLVVIVLVVATLAGQVSIVAAAMVR
ncbi:MAG: UbiA family prenyltransferase [Intrasporangiaceae bacterium]|nr:UbiA family prenyltransferase [Intrasporangiaceae bacterium]